MKDPYVLENGVLKNKFNINSNEFLKVAEEITIPFKMLTANTINSKNGCESLKETHNHLFNEIYEWSGEFRTIPIEKAEKILGNDTIRYTAPKDIEKELKKIFKVMNETKFQDLSIEDRAVKFSSNIAAIWKVHPFRDGNTRTITTFAQKFLREKGLDLNLEIIKENHKYFRDCLVKASDGQYAETKYLEKIIKDCMENVPKKKLETELINSLEKNKNFLNEKVPYNCLDDAVLSKSTILQLMVKQEEMNFRSQGWVKGSQIKNDALQLKKDEKPTLVNSIFRNKAGALEKVVVNYYNKDQFLNKEKFISIKKENPLPGLTTENIIKELKVGGINSLFKQLTTIEKSKDIKKDRGIER